jgi:hypothetical protein
MLTQASFGNPVGETAYTLCLYDQNGGVPTFVMGATIAPAGICGARPCWQALSDRGWRYKNKDGTGDGITRVSLMGGPVGRPKVQIGGKGLHLSLPAPSGLQYFDVDPALIIQLHSSDPPACWSSTFDAAAVDSNDGTEFKARSH